jgi:hypothetical protein
VSMAELYLRYSRGGSARAHVAEHDPQSPANR